MTAPKKQLSDLRHNQQFLVVLIFSLVTIVVWVTVGLFSSQHTSSISPELQKLAEPLNPNINTEVLSQIEQKRAYDASQLLTFPIYSVAEDAVRQQRSQNTAAPTGTTLTSTTNLNGLLPEPTPEVTAESNAEQTPETGTENQDSAPPTGTVIEETPPPATTP